MPFPRLVYYTAHLLLRHAYRSRRLAKELEWAYDDYRDKEIDRYIEANAAAFEALKEAKWKEDRERYSLQPRAWQESLPAWRS